MGAGSGGDESGRDSSGQALESSSSTSVTSADVDTTSAGPESSDGSATSERPAASASPVDESSEEFNPFAIARGNDGARIADVAVLDDGRIVSGSQSGLAYIAEPGVAETGGSSWWDSLPVYEGHSDRIQGVAALADGRVASSSTDGTVQIWDPNDPDSEPTVFETPNGDFYADVVQLIDGRIAAATRQGPLLIWDLNDEGSPPVQVAGISGFGVQLALLPDGRILDSTLKQVTDIDDPTNSVTLVRPEEGFADPMAILPDGKIVTASRSGVLSVWDLSDPSAPAVSIAPHFEDVFALLATSDGRVVSSGDNGLWLWDPTSAGSPQEMLTPKQEQELAPLEGDRLAQARIGWSVDWVALAEMPDGRILSVGQLGSSRLWDLADFPRN